MSEKDFLNFAHELADAAAEITLPLFRNLTHVENKSEQGFDPVTQADRQAEQVMRDLVQQHYPDHAIYGEEFGRTGAGDGAGDYEWIFDPIDGTRAYICGVPVWGTLIGLYHKHMPLLGVMDQPFTGERFFASQAKAIWQRDGKMMPLTVRACADMSAAIIATAAPETAPSAPIWDAIISKVRLIRYGLDCTGYALLAAGQIDAVIEKGLNQFDIAALIPLVEAAGGIITKWDGSSPAQGGDIIACGDKRLHAQLLTMLV